MAHGRAVEVPPEGTIAGAPEDWQHFSADFGAASTSSQAQGLRQSGRA
jgi:hypothetical protein